MKAFIVGLVCLVVSAAAVSKLQEQEFQCPAGVKFGKHEECSKYYECFAPVERSCPADTYWDADSSSCVPSDAGCGGLYCRFDKGKESYKHPTKPYYYYVCEDGEVVEEDYCCCSDQWLYVYWDFDTHKCITTHNPGRP